MVYNFALPPLVLHTFYRGDATLISDWAANLAPPSDTTHFFNILDTHDGIGLMGVQGILSAEDIDFIVRTAQERGAYVSFKMTEDRIEQPYEINCTWWSAINDVHRDEELAFQVKRYLASRSLQLAIRGVPGIYIHGALGTANDYPRVAETGVKREVNRGLVDAAAVEAELGLPGSRIGLLSRAGTRLHRLRTRHRSFHPNGRQAVLKCAPEVFAVLRSAPEGGEHILALTNVTDRPVRFEIPLAELPVRARRWRDLVTKRIASAEAGRLAVPMLPYDVVWLLPLEGAA
jgi:sucrose phosphorylase